MQKDAKLKDMEQSAARVVSLSKDLEKRLKLAEQGSPPQSADQSVTLANTLIVTPQVPRERKSSKQVVVTSTTPADA